MTQYDLNIITSLPFLKSCAPLPLTFPKQVYLTHVCCENFDHNHFVEAPLAAIWVISSFRRTFSFFVLLFSSLVIFLPFTSNINWNLANTRNHYLLYHSSTRSCVTKLDVIFVSSLQSFFLNSKILYCMACLLKECVGTEPVKRLKEVNIV